LFDRPKTEALESCSEVKGQLGDKTGFAYAGGADQETGSAAAKESMLDQFAWIFCGFESGIVFIDGSTWRGFKNSSHGIFNAFDGFRREKAIEVFRPIFRGQDSAID
jgi:hypothetical protein